MKDELQRLIYDESGIGIVEIILILVVLVGLVVIFKDQISSLVNKALSSISSQADGL